MKISQDLSQLQHNGVSKVIIDFKVKKYEKAISNQHSNNVQQNIQHPRAAELINYNPDELFIEPLTQGQILNEVVAMCRKENICIESNIDEIGGLAFYRKFTKIY